jgi:uncharacterized protein (DUF362 family)
MTNGTKHGRACSRRAFLGAAAAGPWMAGATLARAAATAPPKQGPTSPVAIARCAAYDPSLLRIALDTMNDQLGGLRKMVNGKTVAVKVNLVGSPRQGFGGKTSGRTYNVNFEVVRAVVAMLGRGGAKRVRILESSHQALPFEEFLTGAGWDVPELFRLGVPVELEDTRNLGQGKTYHELKVPGGGMLFPAYHVNHSYVDCDVYVSLGKLKNHATAGVTLGMKNNFGVTPIALYGQDHADEASVSPRAMFHDGKIGPDRGLPQEIAPGSPRRATYRVPRHAVDAAAMRPIDLVVLDGIESVSGGEGPWVGTLKVQTPGLLIAGRNAVCTDAIATAVMGYDPMAAPATGPFPGDNHLALAAALGLGTNDPSRIEVRGLTVAKALHRYGWEPSERG